MRDELAQKSDRLSNFRMVVFLCFVGLLIVFFSTHWITPIWFAPLFLVFLILIVIHEKTEARRRSCEEAMDYYQFALDRIAHRWKGRGNQRKDFVDANHPFAMDLDIFGEGSLYEMICTARTRQGQRILADWLTHPTDRETIYRRQKAVEELSDRLDLREDLAILGGTINETVRKFRLAAWGEREAEISPARRKAIRVIGIALSALTFAGLIIWLLTNWGPLPLVTALALVGLFGRIFRKSVERIVREVQEPKRELMVLALLLQRLENESFNGELLSELKRSFFGDAEISASQAVGKLGGMVTQLDAAANQIFAPFAFAMLWRLQFALSIEKWRSKHGHRLGKWMEAAGALEALCALSCFAYEHPAYPFPEIETDRTVLSGRNLKHPLLPDEGCVSNSVSLGEKSRVWMVSGSNMSGKSTFLRIVGINAVLAMAGAPIAGSALRIRPVNIGATIRVQDSLLEGDSRFFAEIKRLQQMIKIASDGQPLLFLLDEILHGTNSQDRRIGANAIIQRLMEMDAIGLVTTHDLALAEAANDLGDLAANVHFEDTLIDGRLVFDYKVKPGVVKKSNALELMRSLELIQ